MLLTVSTTMPSASDLGYLLHKHPGRVQSFPQPTGVAHVFYPEAREDRCTAALLLEVDPVALVRGRGRHDTFAFGSYINDRPYAASSLLAIALKQVFRSALAGRCEARPELAAAALPLELHLPSLSCAEGPDLITRMFAPLGWRVDAEAEPLDPETPAWGPSPTVDVRLTGTLRLADALNQLYVLLPVLDDGKHYWVGDDEVEKLVRAGGGWLAGHPERETIARRYLAHRPELTRSALGRLAEADDLPEQAFEDAESVPAPPNLATRRREAVLAAVRAGDRSRVGDLGCGEGALLPALLDDPAVQHVTGVDVSVRALQRAARRLGLDTMPPTRRTRIELAQSSLVYRDDRLRGLDVAILMEVIEHLEAERLPALERAVFAAAAPRRVIVTTPNAEANVRFQGLAAGAMRHPDHRFEFTRAAFVEWAQGVAARNGYRVSFEGVGDSDPAVGAPTQLALFEAVTA